MGDRWCTRDGWAVEVIHVIATPDGHDGESFRVTQHGCWVGYARSVAELEQYVDLAELEPELVDDVCDLLRAGSLLPPDWRGRRIDLACDVGAGDHVAGVPAQGRKTDHAIISLARSSPAARPMRSSPGCPRPRFAARQAPAPGARGRGARCSVCRRVTAEPPSVLLGSGCGRL
jgi:hypothetical protein